MVTMNVEYQSNLRTEIHHLQSGSQIITDAPLDNKGKGEAFSPTDLMSSSLGACMLTIMGIRADTLDISIDGTKVVLTKHMSTSTPRRVVKIEVDMSVPHQLSKQHLTSLKRVALSCPVAKSLHPDLKVALSISCKS